MINLMIKRSIYCQRVSVSQRKLELYILRIKLNIFESACRTYIKSLTDTRLILDKKKIKVLKIITILESRVNF
jgi:hypothetical protein